MNLTAAKAGGESDSFFTFIKKVQSERGFMSLYQGLEAGIVRQIFYATSRFGLFEVIRDRLAEYRETDLYSRLLSGCSSGGLAALISCPAEVTLVRISNDATLPADQRRNYKGIVNAFQRILSEEGPKAFFRGSGPFVNRAMLVGGVQVGMATLSPPSPPHRRKEPMTNSKQVSSLLASQTISQMSFVLLCPLACSTPSSPCQWRQQRIGWHFKNLILSPVPLPLKPPLFSLPSTLPLIHYREGLILRNLPNPQHYHLQRGTIETLARLCSLLSPLRWPHSVHVSRCGIYSEILFANCFKLSCDTDSLLLSAQQGSQWWAAERMVR
jgi:hypothetical protein